MIFHPPLLLRVDASRQHGTGHLMRSLALASAWEQAGGSVHIATASDLSPYREWMGEFEFESIETEPGSREDARATLGLQRKYGAEWVAADGYQFGSEYQGILHAAGVNLLIFDDYGHGAPYLAALILNQNPSATPTIYEKRGVETRLLLGTRYSLLRPQFAQWRGWKRSRAVHRHRVLLTFGGTDPQRISLKAIEAVRGLEGIEAVLVVGGGCAHRDEIERHSVGSGVRIEWKVGDMAALISSCDFALLAAGTTTLECAFLQTPMVTLAIADNQVALAASLAKAGAAENLGWHEEVTPESMRAAIVRLRDNDTLWMERSRKAGELVDGYGAERVVSQMRGYSIPLRRATASDAQAFWCWSNDAETRKASFRSDPIPWAEHLHWLTARLSDPDSYLWVAREGEEPIGLVRFQRSGARCVISLVVAPEFRGCGLGAALAARGSAEMFRAAPVDSIDAWIRPENHASQKTFRRAGYAQMGESEYRGNAAVRYELRRTD